MQVNPKIRQVAKEGFPAMIGQTISHYRVIEKLGGDGSDRVCT